MSAAELPRAVPCHGLCGGVAGCPVPCALAGAQVLARIDTSRFHDGRTEAYREEVRAWLRANGVDPCAIPSGPGARDVEVVLLDAPAIVRAEYVPNEAGRPQRDPADTERIWTRVVHSLCRVPLPGHLADPPARSPIRGARGSV